ncbi:hypothetical protein SNE40_006938 [Patella caerulea]|uniref:Thioredoxin-like fold domain-containing protein n=1 Tax=Patella caerulea TaxID=87958 RepID=A0AAN8Q7D0_PATCE
MFILFYVSACVLALISTGESVPIPNRPLGFVYNCSCENAPIKLTVFMEVFCPDSRETHPHLLEVADYYGPQKLQLTYHMFPLPYHIRGFHGTKALYVVDLVTNGTKTFDFYNRLLQNLNLLSTTNTMNMTTDDSIDIMAGFAEDYGVPKSRFMSLMSNSDVEHITRVAWKYACTRGVAGTPIHFINDIAIDGGQEWTLDKWRSVIDPLLNDTTVFSNQRMIPTTCVRPANRACV